jgi:hypothetical protein
MPSGAGTLIPALRTLAEADEEIGLRELLTKAVELTNGNGAHRRKSPARGVRAPMQDKAMSLGAS